MHSKQSWLLGILAAVLLALVSFIVWVKPPENKKEGSPEPIFPKLQSDAVTHIEVTRGADSSRLVFDRAAGTWQMTEPMHVAADDRKVSDLAGRITGMEAGKPIEAAAPEQFGLGAHPVATVRFDAGEGGEKTVFIGNAAPVGYSTYVQVAEGGPVLPANGRFGADFLKPADEFRDHSAWKFAESDVDRVAWSYLPSPDAEGARTDGGEHGKSGPTDVEDAAEKAGGNALAEAAEPEEAEDGEVPAEKGPTAKAANDKLPDHPVEGLLRKDANGWWLGEDGPRADESKVQSFLRDAAGLKIKSFSAGPVAAEKDVARLVVIAGGGVHTVEILGAKDGDELARVPLQDAPVVVERSALKLAARDPASFLASTLVPVHRYTLTRIELKLGDFSWSSTKVDGKWSDPATDSLLDALEEARATRTLAGSAQPETVWGSITLAEGDTHGDVLAIGPPLSDGTHAVGEEAGGPGFVVSDTVLDGLESAVTSKAAAEPQF
jgi:hypothetical protein